MMSDRGIQEVKKKVLRGLIGDADVRGDGFRCRQANGRGFRELKGNPHGSNTRCGTEKRKKSGRVYEGAGEAATKAEA